MKVSAEEEGALLRIANEQGVTVARLLVESALASDRGETRSEREQVLATLFQLHRLLASVSNNVNQIARATNATRETQPETFETLAEVRRVAMQIDGQIDRLALG